MNLRALPFFGLLLLAFAASACDKRAHCTGWNGSNGHLLSAGALTSCSDQKNRDVRCARGETGKPYVCTCVEGGTTGKTFQRMEALPDGAENLSKVGVEQCDWALK